MNISHHIIYCCSTVSTYMSFCKKEMLNADQLFVQWIQFISIKDWVNCMVYPFFMARNRNHEIMHVGIICQLNYHGGGLLQYQVRNESSHIVFTQSPFLRVGQRVSFIQRCVRGTAEAVDIQRLASHEGLDAENLEQSKVSLHSEDMRRKDISTVSTVDRPQHCEAVGLRAEAAGSMQWKDGEQNVNHTVAKRKEIDASSSARDGRVLSQTRRLQRSIGVFHNADSQERLAMVKEAEDVLQHLLEEPEIDGDGICKLLRRCVGWLHVPIPFDRPTVANNQDLSTDEMNLEEHHSEHSNLQARVRRLLILALNALDLTDAVTFQAVEEALNYIRILLQQAERSGFEARVARSKQWRKLSLLVKRDSLKRKDRASSVNDIFQPNRKVMNLPLVFKSSEEVRLTCSRCSHSIISSWFWRHPKTEKVHVLVPNQGHLPCSRPKKWPWIVEGNAVPKNDHFKELDFCPHHRVKAQCKDCGGREVCVHNRCYYRCKFCRTSRRTQRVERDGHFAAPVCRKHHKDSLSIYLFCKDSHLPPEKSTKSNNFHPAFVFLWKTWARVTNFSIYGGGYPLQTLS